MNFTKINFTTFTLQYSLHNIHFTLFTLLNSFYKIHFFKFYFWNSLFKIHEKYTIKNSPLPPKNSYLLKKILTVKLFKTNLIVYKKWIFFEFHFFIFYSNNLISVTSGQTDIHFHLLRQCLFFWSAHRLSQSGYCGYWQYEPAGQSGRQLALC